MASEMAIGMAMAQQMMQQQGGVLGAGATTPAAAAPAPAAPAASPDILTPADVAKVLNVAESDVVASLEAGDLKGRKIGTVWRVTKAALDDFLKN
ncbi:MAG: helix-turn-helix domain-containing protein [Chthoniobacteraceae bacterium]